ncbi:MAG: hypothetical protein QM784_20105 [Polyangiaceae bacterium]
MPSDDSAQAATEPEIPRLAWLMTILSVPALVWNRALLPALPGSRFSIERLFDHVTFVGGVLSQLLAMGLTLLLIKLAIANVRAFSMGLSGRLMVLPVGTTVAFLVVASSLGPLEPEMHLLLAGLGTLAQLSSLRPTLRHPPLRAGGLMLLFSSLGSLFNSFGRLLALRASFEALPREYAVARIISTVGEGFELAAVVFVCTWLLMARPLRTAESNPTEAVHERIKTATRVAIVVALGLTSVILARTGRAPTASTAEIILSRAVSALGREPSPHGAAILSPFLELASLGLALVLLGRPRHVAAPHRIAIALVLLGRCAPDIPAHCALMTAGAWLLLWYAPSPARPTTTDPPVAA